MAARVTCTILGAAGHSSIVDCQLAVTPRSALCECHDTRLSNRNRNRNRNRALLWIRTWEQ